MIVSNIPGSTLPALASIVVAGPFLPGTAQYRRTIRTTAAFAMMQACEMMQGGASPAEVARYVQGLGMPGAMVSHVIEDAALPGTFADAVFSILAD